MDWGWDRDGDGGREGAPWVHPSQFVGVESLTKTLDSSRLGLVCILTHLVH